MYKIKNRKMYDTDTATILDSYDNGFAPGDDYHLLEELYQKQLTNEFFLFGMGGFCTKYGRYSDLWTITPLTDEEAKDWIEEYGNADTYITLFGAPEE